MTDSWSQGAVKIIKELLNEDYMIFRFTEKVSVRDLGGLIAGDFYVQLAGKDEENLADRLIKEGHATYNETKFKLSKYFRISHFNQ